MLLQSCQKCSWMPSDVGVCVPRSAAAEAGNARRGSWHGCHWARWPFQCLSSSGCCDYTWSRAGSGAEEGLRVGGAQRLRDPFRGDSLWAEALQGWSFLPCRGPSILCLQAEAPKTCPRADVAEGRRKARERRGKGGMRSRRAPRGPGGFQWAPCVSWSWTGAGAPLLALGSWGPSCRGSYLW